MAVLGTTAKGALAVKGAKGVAKNPAILRAGAKAAPPTAKLAFRVGKPVAKRRARRRAQRVGESARTVATTLAVHGPQAAQELGLMPAPKRKRTLPRILVGMLLGAGLVYFLDPQHGSERRQRLSGAMS